MTGDVLWASGLVGLVASASVATSVAEAQCRRCGVSRIIFSGPSSGMLRPIETRIVRQVGSLHAQSCTTPGHSGFVQHSSRNFSEPQAWMIIEHWAAPDIERSLACSESPQTTPSPATRHRTTRPPRRRKPLARRPSSTNRSGHGVQGHPVPQRGHEGPLPLLPDQPLTAPGTTPHTVNGHRGISAQDHQRD